jgi:hypothetical protein
MPETTSTPTSPDTVTIRRAGPEDAELVQTMVMEIAAHEGDVEHVQVTADHWREQLADPHVIVFVAARDGQPAGYVSAAGGGTCGAGTGWSASTTSMSVSSTAANGSVSSSWAGWLRTPRASAPSCAGR